MRCFVFGGELGRAHIAKSAHTQPQNHTHTNNYNHLEQILRLQIENDVESVLHHAHENKLQSSLVLFH